MQLTYMTDYIIKLHTFAFFSEIITEEDMIYWVDTNIQTISRIKRDLSQRENIITDGISRVESLAVDWVAGQCFGDILSQFCVWKRE